MGLSEKLGFDKKISIDWEITPADTFGIFESWGGKERVRNKSERFYYFYIDAWSLPAKLCLMERGIKHAKVLAYIDAPQDMIDASVAGQGKGMLDKSYAIDDTLMQWLSINVLEPDDDAKVKLINIEIEEESLETDLPGKNASASDIKKVLLRNTSAFISENDVEEIIKKDDFFDTQYNPNGSFSNCLIDNGDRATVTDLKIGIMWQRYGCDIGGIRQIQAHVDDMNKQNFAGFNDWRLPTMEEALSLMEPVRNDKGLYLHPCFSKEQPFIFLADQRKPGGYWFVDFKQGSVFWASGTIPGGFGRVCRTV